VSEQGEIGGMTGTRAEVWSRLSARVRTLEQLMGSATIEQWTLPCEAEGWSVGLVGCHVGLGLRRQAGWLERVAAGGKPHDFSWDRTHKLNALVQRRVLRPDRAEVLRSLAAGLDRWHRLLGTMTESELARTAFRQGPNERSVEWVAGVLAVRHIDEHTRSIRTALGVTDPSRPSRSPGRRR
jgi:DinB family protein